MKVVWTRAAQIDAAQAFGYLAERSPDAARTLEQRIFAAVDGLERYPFSGPVGVVQGTRQLVVPRTRYKVIYTVEPDRALVLRVLHGARQWPPED